ncbi:MAG: hypothetical protein VYB54_07615 [Pseudomonadota bacterium]|nr:hypothetical protein [Pseudomonadota bacterium]
MRRGPKGLTPEEKQARGTYQPCRDDVKASSIEVDESDVPIMPDWLTDAGKAVWLDELPRAMKFRTVTEADSTAFGNYCNLQGAIQEAWRDGSYVPTAQHLIEARKMAEQFGIFGSKSRMKTGAEAPSTKANPFSRARPGGGR